MCCFGRTASKNGLCHTPVRVPCSLALASPLPHDLSTGAKSTEEIMFNHRGENPVGCNMQIEPLLENRHLVNKFHCPPLSKGDLESAPPPRGDWKMHRAFQREEGLFLQAQPQCCITLTAAR